MQGAARVKYEHISTYPLSAGRDETMHSVSVRPGGPDQLAGSHYFPTFGISGSERDLLAPSHRVWCLTFVDHLSL